MHRFLFLLIAILFIQTISEAQQADSVKAVLNEIVVTATKSETPLYAIGSSVSVITAKDISERQARTVIDVLREEPGLSVIEQGGPGKLSNVFMRGANSNHTLVIVDGVTMNDASSPNNAFDFSMLNTNDIARIEIVRGPQSTLYGSDALAGIINIITKRGGTSSRYLIESEAGSNNYYNGKISAAGSIGRINYFINAGKRGSAGISASDAKFGNSEKDGYGSESLTSRFDIGLPANLQLDLIYKFSKSTTALDQSGKFGDDPNYDYNIEEHLFKTGLTYSGFENRWKQQLNASYIKRFSHSLDQTDQLHPSTSSDSFNKAERIKLDWQNNLSFFENNLITLGAEIERERAKTSYYSTSEWGPFYTEFPEQSMNTTGLYFQDQLSLQSRFFVTAGLRYDNNEKFGGVTTYRIASAYLIQTTGTKLKMSYGSGFKAPSLFYLFDPAFGNPDLKPETSRGYDAGIEQIFDNGNYKIGVTYFDMKLQNMFGFDSNFRTVNIAEAASSGIEFTASAGNLRNFSLSLNYTYNKTNDDYNLSPDYNKPLLRRPLHQANFILNYKLNERANFGMQIRYSGKRDDKDFSSWDVVRVTMPDYTLINLTASYKIFHNLEMNARIENLFNKQYEEVLYYGTLGRSFYIGLSFDF